MPPTLSRDTSTMSVGSSNGPITPEDDVFGPKISSEFPFDFSSSPRDPQNKTIDPSRDKLFDKKTATHLPSRILPQPSFSDHAQTTTITPSRTLIKDTQAPNSDALRSSSVDMTSTILPAATRGTSLADISTTGPHLTRRRVVSRPLGLTASNHAAAEKYFPSNRTIQSKTSTFDDAFAMAKLRARRETKQILEEKNRPFEDEELRQDPIWNKSVEELKADLADGRIMFDEIPTALRDILPQPILTANVLFPLPREKGRRQTRTRLPRSTSESPSSVSIETTKANQKSTRISQTAQGAKALPLQGSVRSRDPRTPWPVPVSVDVPMLSISMTMGKESAPFIPRLPAVRGWSGSSNPEGRDTEEKFFARLVHSADKKRKAQELLEQDEHKKKGLADTEWKTFMDKMQDDGLVVEGTRMFTDDGSIVPFVIPFRYVAPPNSQTVPSSMKLKRKMMDCEVPFLPLRSASPPPIRLKPDVVSSLRPIDLDVRLPAFSDHVARISVDDGYITPLKHVYLAPFVSRQNQTSPVEPSQEEIKESEPYDHASPDQQPTSLVDVEMDIDVMPSMDQPGPSASSAAHKEPLQTAPNAPTSDTHAPPPHTLFTSTSKTTTTTKSTTISILKAPFEAQDLVKGNEARETFVLPDFGPDEFPVVAR